eukprot:gi/632972948/ref/XP_007902909.1/ PREDICTED: uncharacterized protein LOC103185955 [Callorhinchus milii]
MAKREKLKEGNRSRDMGDYSWHEGPVGSLNQPEQQVPLKTSVAVLKYSPSLAKMHDQKKHRKYKKKDIVDLDEDIDDDNEPQFWSSTPGSTEVHFSGHAVRHLKTQIPKSQSLKSSTSSTMGKPPPFSLSKIKPPQFSISKIKPASFSTSNLRSHLSPSKSSLRKVSSNLDQPPKEKPPPVVTDSGTTMHPVEVYRGSFSCFHYLCDQMCCKTRSNSTEPLNISNISHEELNHEDQGTEFPPGSRFLI